MLLAIDEKPSLVFLPSPPLADSDPLPLEDIEVIVEQAGETLVVVDEMMATESSGTTTTSAACLLPHYTNLIILQVLPTEFVGLR